MATYKNKKRGHTLEAHKFDGKLSNLPGWCKKLIIIDDNNGRNAYVKCNYNGLERELNWPEGRYLVKYPYGTEIVRAEDFEPYYNLVCPQCGKEFPADAEYTGHTCRSEDSKKHNEG